MNLFEQQSTEFQRRHIGINEADMRKMLQTIGVSSLDELMDKTVPATIRMQKSLNLPAAMSEHEYLKMMKDISIKNKTFKSYIGQGYYDTITPSVILRNVFENPGWYTQYTPYQAEISQGRLESLLNFQTVVSDLTALPIANASLLDEATAAAEAMSMLFHYINKTDKIERAKFFVDNAIFPQTKDVLITRAKPIGVELIFGDYKQAKTDNNYFGAIVQYPNNYGAIEEYRDFINKVHSAGGFVVMATDLLALALLTPPGELGADVAVGSAQRFGVPFGFGGPHVALLTQTVAEEIEQRDFELVSENFFDTIVVKVDDSTRVMEKAERQQINLRYIDNNHIGISLDETTTVDDLYDLINCFENVIDPVAFDIEEEAALTHIPLHLTRTSSYLTHPVFNTHRSESQVMRYMKQLENKDLALNTSMIPLGSCTMKLNAASEMIPLSWNHWSKMHPFTPSDQTEGYSQVLDELSDYLCKLTAFDACSLQPNSGAQGEYAGLLTIKAYHESHGDHHRNVMLIPISAHGTNPASAVMAGMKVVVVKALENGYVDVADLKAKAQQHAANLAGIMITYPSTYGVYEETVKEITNIVHQYGGQVYMDGANMNAQVGLTAPGLIGADVCHLNLHKTFSIPHGGGGPGMGPICCAKHLAPFLPRHGIINEEQGIKNVELSTTNCQLQTTNAVSAAPYGSASILLISYGYIRMLGADGVKAATEYAILNANYMRARLQEQFDILYTNHNGQCAHEFIVDLRPFKTTTGIEAEDVAKRLMDYGFHAPTMSFPVPGTIMIEPTESEDKAELDRFCDALLSIRDEILAIEEGRMDKTDNPLKNSPHTQQVICADEWNHKYSRKDAAFPLYYVTHNKFWPAVSRINNTYGDRNLICTCEPVGSYEEQEV